MDSAWKRLVMLLVTIEGFLVGCLLLYGPQGVHNTLQCKQKQQKLLARADALLVELESSSRELHTWRTDSFLKEQYARDTLEMARPQELIYQYAQDDSTETVPG